VDVLKSMLFAKNPDVSCEPAASTQPPPEKELQQRAREDAQQQTQQQVQQLAPVVHQIAASGALQQVLPQVVQAVQGAGQQDPQKAIEAQAQQQAQTQMAPYQQARADAKQFAQTIELVVAQLWKQSGLKQQALPLVGSALSIGVGWLKSTWQERTGPNPDPTAQNTINDLQDQIAQIKAMQEELAEGEAANQDATLADLQQKIQGLQSQTEAVVARGLAIDFENGENIQVAPECGPLTNYLQAPWIAHRSFIPVDEDTAKFPKIADKVGTAKLFYAKKPKDLADRSTNESDSGAVSQTSEHDADSYSSSTEQGSSDKGNVALWEVWNKDDGVILPLIEGVDVYAAAPYPPNPGTTRFYGFFLYPIGVVDGERHPRSLIARSSKLFDEYNRARSNWRKARFRAIPKTAFNSAAVEPAQMEKLRTATSQEMVGIDLKDPEKNINEVLGEVKYAQINEALFDTAPIMREIEKIWGVQEALTQGVSVAKTATEAEIQQTGTNSRTGYMKDGLDDLMTDFAHYTAEIAVQKMDREDVVRIAGIWAFWPEGMKVADLPTLVEISIRAGSSGKPNTAQRQHAWAVTLPQLMNAVQTIGQLRGSTPEDVADCYEEIIVETLNRTGDRIDADRFLPEPPPQGKAPTPSGPPPKPSDLCMQGPQIQSMTLVCDQVRQRILSPETAIAILAAGFPNVPVPQIQQMVEGVASLPPAAPPNPIPVNKTASGVIPAPDGAASGTVQ